MKIMKSGKIVKKLFSKVEAENAATYQCELAKKQGRPVFEVHVVNAYELYQANGWFKSSPFKMLGIPSTDQYMVVLYYNVNVVPVKRTSALKTKLVAVAKTKTASTMFKIVRLNIAQLNNVKATAFNHVSDTTLSVVRFSYNTTRTLGEFAFISNSFAAPTYRCQIAA
jgi:hypothetical protein